MSRNKKPSLIFMGPPGCGKGTQAGILVKKSKYDHVSVGDILRKEISAGSDIGLRIKSIVESGNLIDDGTSFDLIKNYLAMSRIIIDGFPRSYSQAIMLINFIKINDLNYRLVYFRDDTSWLENRIVNRMTCRSCGSTTSTAASCDDCGGELYKRKDDNKDTLLNRIDVFKKDENDIISLFRANNINILELKSDSITEKAELIKGFIS